ncbi:10606_t:CDS:1, partial [Dentiscutata heterogama]
VKIENGCKESTIVAYTEIIHYLERLDLTIIKPEVSLVSGIIDLSRNEDLFANLLLFRSKQILIYYKFDNNEFLGKIKFIVNDFVNMYKDLRPDFDPVLM